MPAGQHDFGCCDALIGGVPALQKARRGPAGEFGVFSPAEPSLGPLQSKESMPGQRQESLPLVDQGAARFEQKREQLELAFLTSKATAKAFKLVPMGAEVN